MGISREQALDCFNSDDLIGIGMEADAVRRNLHPEGVVTYVIDRPVSYATAGIHDKVDEALSMGASGIVLRGEVLPGVTIAWFERLLTDLKASFPTLWLHGLSATEIATLATQSGLSLETTIARLQAGGLDSISGSDAGILDDTVSSATPRCTTTAWFEVHRTAHRLGMQTTAAMLFGSGESAEHRINHLEAVRRLQEETGGFSAFTPVPAQPAAIGIQGFEEATAVEYMKTLSISRMFLDTIPNLQADWSTQGLKVLQMALRFGSNDVGSVMPTEGLTTPDGTTEEDLRRVIRGAGFRPVQRDTMYRTVFLT